MIIIFKKYKLRIILILSLIVMFLLNLCLEYSRYLDLIDEEVYQSKVDIQNVHPKSSYDILKLKSNNFEFFANIEKDQNIKKYDSINAIFLTSNIGFVDYLKGSFYSKIIYFDFIEKKEDNFSKIINHINSNHEDEMIKELFQTLFLGTYISKELRTICTNYGIAHVIALSGFHLAVLSFVIYWILYYPYAFFHQRYFPYRNKKFDLILISILFLFYYLILTDIIPSLFRSFVMLILGVFLLRYNIKIVSYMNLFFTFLIVIALFPKFLFSLGFCFSIIAVFYIFLYIQYFKNLNKYFQIIFFDLWMFLVFNPIVHLYFPQTSYEQFLSIPINILFPIFYISEIIAHIFEFSSYFDSYIKAFLDYKIVSFDVTTSIYFIVFYTFISVASVFNKKAFFVLNALVVSFNLYLYLRF